jgi:hypothetical protein
VYRRAECPALSTSFRKREGSKKSLRRQGGQSSAPHHMCACHPSLIHPVPQPLNYNKEHQTQCSPAPSARILKRMTQEQARLGPRESNVEQAASRAQLTAVVVSAQAGQMGVFAAHDKHNLRHRHQSESCYARRIDAHRDVSGAHAHGRRCIASMQRTCTLCKSRDRACQAASQPQTPGPWLRAWS